MTHHQNHLVCIGAGPKAIALGAHLWALKRLGFDVPRFTVVDSVGIGANWLGNNGFTDGVFPVDTSPLKDLGFPYQSRLGPAVDDQLVGLSFYEFLRDTNQLVPWVNRGLPPISHARLAKYLQWASHKIDLPLVAGRVVELEPTGGQCRVVLRRGSELETLTADAVVITGPGDAVLVPVSGDAPERVSDGRSYWVSRERLASTQPRRIAVVGAGQSAATVALSARSMSPQANIDIITRRGFLAAQSGGFHENALCSKPGTEWRELTVAQRVDVLRRVNNGVVDSRLKAQLDSDERISVIAGSVQRVVTEATGATVLLHGEKSGDSPVERRVYDYVVLAMGFDPVAQVKRLLPLSSHTEGWVSTLGQVGTTDEHLRVSGAPFALHAPALCVLDSGPGVSLLSCLGDVASAIAAAYAKPSSAPINLGCPCRRSGSTCRKALFQEGVVQCQS